MAEPNIAVAPESALRVDRTGGPRVALSPYVFRGMMVGMAGVAVVLDRVTGRRDLTWRFAKAQARTLARLLGVRVTMRGLEHLDPHASYVFTPNHQSHLDIVALLGYLPGPTRFAAKHELWRQPIVGAILDTLGMVPIDRERPQGALAALARAVADGGSIVIFPEGTRSRTGTLLPFKRGAFTLAIASRLPIVPVVCRGTRRLMPRGSRLTVLPGDVEVIVQQPIPTADLCEDDREALAARVRQAIERYHTGW
ncbi:MAG TPA: lysophospholipid acyltransferase family protein [Candidatus Binatia bacterium]|jgi:1-acyl-sn-glycerol-3-phosphate acyltransferase|nr:lysophospholipid acyltransferase family protein [Candidatus Binatia bacterium]